MKRFYFILTILLLFSLQSLAFKPVCDRSPVIKASLESSLLRTCDKITEKELAILNELTVFDDQLDSLAEGDLDGLTSVTGMFIYSRNLKTIASKTFTQLQSLTNLTIFGYELTDLQDASFFDLPSLVYLTIRAKQIDIKRATFQRIPQLNSLSIYSTFDSTIEPKAFHGIPLLTLSLQMGLYDKDFAALSGLQILTSLTLTGNHFRKIRTGTYSSFPALETLVLSENEIDEIVKGALQLPSLKTLNLSENLLTQINQGDFAGLPNLENLILDHNSISILSPGSFDGLKKLSYLQLGTNGLTNLPNHIFDDLSSAFSISLDHNLLTSFPLSTFEKLMTLKGLNLDFNQINNIDPALLNEMDPQSIIYLRRNRVPDSIRQSLNQSYPGRFRF